MKSLLPALVAVALFAAAALGQTPTPRPSADEDVVKISTNLVQIDVSVTDKKGNIVRDLKPEDFEIYENGKKQPVTAFSFVSSERVAAPEKKRQPDASETAPVPVPPTNLRPDQVRRTVALIVDDLSLSFESTYQTRRALKRFVDEQMQDGDLVAIIRTGAGVGALQQFTSDKRVLYAAIDRVKWNPVGNPNVGAFAPLQAAQPQLMPTPEPGQGERTPEGIQREFDDMRTNYFAVGTLGAVDYVIRGLGELPGRKSVILFSHGFAMANTDAVGFRGSSPIVSRMRGLVDLANRSSVVIYAVDPRGLAVTSLTAADDTSGLSPEQLREAESGRSSELFESQSGLKYLADETGGFAVVNNNDTVGAVRRVLADQSYYLVGYDPGDDSFDPVARRYNKIEVKLLRPDLKVRYRSGFFNVEQRDNSARTTAAMTPAQQLQHAMMSPFAVNGISVRLNSLFGSDARTGNYVRSLLHVDASGLKFTQQPNGKLTASFEVLAASFGDNGQVIDQLGRSFTISDVNDADHKHLLRDGFVYNFLFPVKKPGAYQYRVAIRDPATGTVGSASQFIEIPNLKKKRLTLSGLVFENLSEARWAAATGKAPPAPPADDSIDATDAMTDTSRRVFRAGTVLRYGFEIYNAAAPRGGSPQLTSRIRIFRDGKLLFEGNESPVPVAGQSNPAHLNMSGALTLGTIMQPGDYVLQVVVTDKLAKDKYKIATQFNQFEIQ